MFVPVGDAWERAYAGSTAHPIHLHQEDFGHPNDRGCYLTGAVFYEMVLGSSCLDVPYTGLLPSDEAAHLREIANQTVRDGMRTRS